MSGEYKRRKSYRGRSGGTTKTQRTRGERVLSGKRTIAKAGEIMKEMIRGRSAPVRYSDYDIFIGIDPGEHTGIAIWNKNSRRILGMFTTDFWGCVKTVEEYIKSIRGKQKVVASHNPQPIKMTAGYDIFNKVLVRIEDPNLNKPIFISQKGSVKGFNSWLRVAQNVGMNKAQARMLIDYFKQNDIDYEAVKPVSTKWTAEDLKRNTGITERTNEHVRDAVRLVFGF